ncbi:MAG TPA: MBL fold metallo-hydrolase [Gemmatimonadales bacterium]|jgi:hypothetical protein
MARYERRLLLTAVALGIAARAQAQEIRVGEPLPRWSAGMLDIHQISTGRGNSALVVMPDGTTLLVDAGGVGDGLPQTDPHPDASRRPGEWIARYVKRHAPDSTVPLDYIMITHFHGDHMLGLTDVLDGVGARTLVDRAWPTYDYPIAAPPSDTAFATYHRLVEDRHGRGMNVERFRVGATNQLVMRHAGAAARWPGFEVRNIIGNGDVWTGRGDSAAPSFPPVTGLDRADLPNENMCSLGIRIRYGAFSWFTGGDLPGTPDPGFPAWHGVEAAAAAAIGPVEAHVVTMHGSIGQESEVFLRTLASHVLIVPAWSATHPAPDVMKRIVNSRYPPAERLVFTTDLREATRIVLAQRATSFAAPPGHVVLRVEPGGSRYWVIVLSSAGEGDEVVAVKGPLTILPRS